MRVAPKMVGHTSSCARPAGNKKPKSPGTMSQALARLPLPLRRRSEPRFDQRACRSTSGLHLIVARPFIDSLDNGLGKHDGKYRRKRIGLTRATASSFFNLF